MASPMGLTASKRGPRSRAWYEASVRHALRNYGRPHALRRNPLARIAHDLQPLHEPGQATFDLAPLRFVLTESVQSVLDSADDADRPQLEIVLRGVMHGRTLQAIAMDLGIGREWLYKTWWPEAVAATTQVVVSRFVRRENTANTATQLSLHR